MIAEGTRRFDLYDFFSILIPGTTFLLGMLPFLPADADVFGFATIGILLILGFVAGRALHALGIYLEQRPSNRLLGIELHRYLTRSHRDIFKKEVAITEDLDDSLVDGYYQEARRCFDDIDLPSSREELVEEDADGVLDTLYAVTRAYIHADARGRSRTFQAILDFQRTMLVTSLILFAIYGTYAIFDAFGRLPTDSVGYTPYIAQLDVSPVLIFFFSAIITISAYLTFERIRTNYRRYYVQYLLADFVVLRSDEHVRN